MVAPLLGVLAFPDLEIIHDRFAFVALAGLAMLVADAADEGRCETIRKEILAACKASLAAHKVPAVIRFVAQLDVTPAGKLVRADA